MLTDIYPMLTDTYQSVINVPTWIAIASLSFFFGLCIGAILQAHHNQK